VPKPKIKPVPANHIVEVKYSDGTTMDFTVEQWAETIARALVERCPDCPRFKDPRS
jgi:hypothetical protein